VTLFGANDEKDGVSGKVDCIDHEMLFNCQISFQVQWHTNRGCYSGTRGLRQGDPISPYLFLICGEAFSCLLNAADVDGRLKGIKVAPNAPSFNHLLFADDSLILLKVKESSVQCLNDILQLYEECSGQTINAEKSSIMFSKKYKECSKEEDVKCTWY
jgi:hypothetical protein